MSAVPARRFALSAVLWAGLAGAAVAQVTPLTPNAGDATDASPDPVAAAPAEVSPVPAPRRAEPRGPRERRRELTEIGWYLFFVTAGALAALVAAAWGVGWFRRSFLQDESPLQTELFDAAARAEIERHRREVQAEKEAAKREGGGGDPGGGEPGETAGETLAEQTAPPPDPAVQPGPPDDR